MRRLLAVVALAALAWSVPLPSFSYVAPDAEVSADDGAPVIGSGDVVAIQPDAVGLDGPALVGVLTFVDADRQVPQVFDGVVRARGPPVLSVSWAWPSTAEANVTLKRGWRVVFAGDSTSNTTPAVTAWYDGGFTAWVASQFTAIPDAKINGTATGGAGVVTGNAGTCVGSAAPTDIVVVNSGTNGDTSAGLDSETQTRIINQAPSALFIAIGTNDVAGGITANAFETNLTSIITKTQAVYPTLPIGVLSVYFRGEKWDTGPVWANTSPFVGHDAAVDAINAKMAAVCVIKGCTFINTRSQFLTWEVANNPGKAATLIGSTDGIHLNSTGKAAIDVMVRSSVTIDQNYP